MESEEDKEIINIGRMALSARVYPEHIIEEIKVMKSTKGIILYGDGINYKVVGDKLAKKWHDITVVKIINGLDVYNENFEQQILMIFHDAENDQRLQDWRNLHIIVIGHFEAIFGANNSELEAEKIAKNLIILKQEELDNILIVGIVNNKNDIDENILTQGKFDVEIEFGAS
ncbi:unnamed protein product [Blepharisma stoltei]|uniref:Vesicle-fusing ATPase n=1 Tax=Blepharisma stoltei TaxID=1481888 RepID=A0AAU9JEP6_9CILI|nr:unnamed protein product [Blepharisma stoltei]